jgi:hypothetical protein
VSYSTDNAQEAIVDALRKVGATVHSTAMVGDGFPDLVVGFRGATYLLEVKTPEAPKKRRGSTKRALRQSQVDWMAAWRGGPVAQVETPEQALAAIGLHVRPVVGYTPPPLESRRAEGGHLPPLGHQIALSGQVVSNKEMDQKVPPRRHSKPARASSASS